MDKTEEIIMSEKEQVNELIEELKDDFHIYRPVHGKHFSGKTLEIDAIAVPKDLSEWKAENVALGIEAKDKMQLSGAKGFTKWIAQCVDYANTKWERFGYIYIFAYPSLIKGVTNNLKLTKDSGVPWLLPRVLAQLGVGELRHDDNRGLAFILNQRHCIWSKKQGIKEGKFRTMKRVFGSRC